MNIGWVVFELKALQKKKKGREREREHDKQQTLSQPVTIGTIYLWVNPY